MMISYACACVRVCTRACVSVCMNESGILVVELLFWELFWNILVWPTVWTSTILSSPSYHRLRRWAFQSSKHQWAVQMRVCLFCGCWKFLCVWACSIIWMLLLFCLISYTCSLTFTARNMPIPNCHSSGGIVSSNRSAVVLVISS